MFRNYLKIGLRNLTRNKSNSVINVLGLSIGIASCLLIMLWVNDELSYDKWNANADRIYRMAAEINFGGTHQAYALAPAPLAAAIVADFPEVENAVRFRNNGSSLVKREFQNYKEENIIFTDSTIFKVFDLELLKGTIDALVEPNSVVINRTTEQKYFGDENALGKTLTFDDSRTFEVTGVIEDMPENSHFNYDFFCSLTGDRRANDGVWVSHNFPTYFTLQEGVDADAFEAKMFPHFLETYISPQIEAIMGASYEEMAKTGAFIDYSIQPLLDIHLKSDLVGEHGPNGSIQYVWIFLSAALFILIIACVNFMNLTTAQSALRAREIGVRKVMGSMRTNLMSQFLCESILLTAFAFALGILLAQLALPSYNELANKNLILPYANPIFWATTAGAILLIGIMAGSYPAFYLSSFKPVQTLSGRSEKSGSKSTLRNVLVVFQFLIAAILIVGTIGIQKQMKYVQSKKLGYDREHVLMVNDAYALGNNQRAFKNRLAENPDVISASYSSFLPVPSSRSDSPLCKSTEMREDNCVAMQLWDIDEDYIQTLGMKLLEGRNFNPDMGTDSMAVILNQRAVEQFGFDVAIDQTIYGQQSFDPNQPSDMVALKVIGVVEDFHFESLRENIRPLCFFLSPSSSYLTIKLVQGNPEQTIAFVERNWKELAAGQPFSYSFMDDRFDQIYQTELRVGKIFSFFSSLAIFIACLGLFGLAAHATERRTREIGIRKVLGASTSGIVGLLSKDFLRLVGIALVIAIPISWYLIKQWLANFAYKVPLDIWMFVIAAVASIILAFITVSFHSVKSAVANPVESLKTE